MGFRIFTLLSRRQGFSGGEGIFCIKWDQEFGGGGNREQEESEILPRGLKSNQIILAKLIRAT